MLERIYEVLPTHTTPEHFFQGNLEDTPFTKGFETTLGSGAFASLKKEDFWV
jgi:hypothetical protein